MKKKVLTIVIGTVIGVVFLLIWLYFIDINTVSYYIRNLKLKFVIIALFFYLLAYYIRAQRWRLLLKQVKKLSAPETFLIMMAGNFTNYMIPLRAGELMKCFFIKKMHGVRMSRSLPSVFLDKLFDTLGILFIFLLVPVLAVTLPPALNILVFLILLILLFGWFILLSAIYAGDKVIILLKKLLFFIPRKYEEKLDETISLFVEGLAIFKDHKRLLIPVFILSISAIALDSFFFYSLFLAFGTEINYLYVLLGYTLIYLSYIIPHPPAQIGSNELIMLLIFAAGFGIKADAASAVMLFSHFLTGLAIVTIGIVAYSYAGVKLLTIINKGEIIYD